MAIWSDMNEFPESGFPVLADVSDRITLGNLYLNPLKANGYMLDILGANRLAGLLVIAGALSGVTSLSMAGALSGVTTLGASGTVTLSSATAPLTLSGASAVLNITGTDAVINMTGARASIGSVLQKVNKAYLKDLDVINRPTVGEDVVALVSDIPKGATGTFTTVDSKTVTVTNGIITSII